MLKKLSAIVFLLDAIAIGLGAFGHGVAVRDLHAAIDQFPIDADMLGVDLHRPLTPPTVQP